MRAIDRRDFDVLAAASGLGADQDVLFELALSIEKRCVVGQKAGLIDVEGCAGLGVLEQALGDLAERLKLYASAERDLRADRRETVGMRAKSPVDGVRRDSFI